MMDLSGSSFELPRDTDPVVSGTRTLGGLKVYERWFLIVSFLNLTATVGLTIQRLVAAIENDPDTPDFTYALVLLINSLFCSYYVIHGVLKELKFELFAFIGAVCVVTVYCVTEYAVHTSGRSEIKLARMIAALILGPVDVWLAYMVAREFGFLAFRIVGASETLQHMYTQTEIFTCLLKFDVQVSVSFVVLVLHNGSAVSLGETVALVVGVPFTLALAWFGWTAMRKEMKSLMVTFDILCLVAPAFVLFKVVEVYLYIKSHPVSYLDYSILAAGALELVIRGMILVESVIVIRNFNYGLKETAFMVDSRPRNQSLLTGIHVRRDGSILQTDEETT